MSVSELKRAQEHFTKQTSQPINAATSPSTSTPEHNIPEEFHNTVRLLLHLINLLPKPDDKQVMCTVYRLIKLNIRSLGGKCLLHLAADQEIEEIFISGFPREKALKVSCADFLSLCLSLSFFSLSLSLILSHSLSLFLILSLSHSLSHSLSLSIILSLILIPSPPLPLSLSLSK